MSNEPLFVACNGARIVESERLGALTLDYRENVHADHKIRVKINSLLENLSHLPDRYLDLLEIASYVYCTDRLIRRGTTEAVEYQAWSRDIRFRIKVRDDAYWNLAKTKLTLSHLLSFMSGDNLQFEFEGGHATQKSNLFDEPGVFPPIRSDSHVALFSGGLDSTTGIRELLGLTDQHLIAVSHKPATTGVSTSQRRILQALQRDFPGRIYGISFSCGLSSEHAKDENQRTRFFLYSSIAAAVAFANESHGFTVFENGVTSLNLPKRQDLMNARSTRTTHPKTVFLLRELFSSLSGNRVSVSTPYADLTKTDVLNRLRECGGANLFDSTVSCSKTYRTKPGRTHCGGCSQCVDRRFAAFGAGLVHEDSSTPYERNFLYDAMESDERGTITDFFAQAAEFQRHNADWLGLNHMNEIAAIAEGWPELDDNEIAERVWNLLNRHGLQVSKAYKTMREVDNPMENRPAGCLFDIIESREHLKAPAKAVAEKLAILLSKSIHIAFQTQKPKDERVLNDQIESILKTQTENVRREHPGIPFGPKKDIPDHVVGDRVVIESKYPRKGSRTKGKIIDEIKSDLVSYCSYGFVLFIIYDPEGLFADPLELQRDLGNFPASAVFVH